MVLRCLVTLLLRLSIVDVLLSELGTQRGDLVLQRCNLLIVFLLHASHAGFDLTHILPNIHVHLTHAAAAATLARHTAGL